MFLWIGRLPSSEEKKPTKVKQEAKEETSEPKKKKTRRIVEDDEVSLSLSLSCALPFVVSYTCIREQCNCMIVQEALSRRFS
jgi:hypothetical protein